MHYLDSKSARPRERLVKRPVSYPASGLAACLLLAACGEGGLDSLREAGSNEPGIGSALGTQAIDTGTVRVVANGYQRISLSWPAIDQAVSYLILQDGLQVGSSFDENYTLTTTNTGYVDYSVVAVFESMSATPLSIDAVVTATVDYLATGTSASFSSSGGDIVIAGLPEAQNGNTDTANAEPGVEPFIAAAEESAQTGASEVAATDGTSPQVLSPVDGGTLPGSSVEVTWRSNDYPGISRWWVRASSSDNSSTSSVYYNSGSIYDTSTNSHTVTDLPTNGEPVHLSLNYLVDGAWQSTGINVIAASSNSSQPRSEPEVQAVAGTSAGAGTSAATVELAWTPAAAQDSGYNVYFSNSSNGEYTFVKAVREFTSGSNNTISTAIQAGSELSLDPQDNACFKITALGVFGESAHSDESCVTVHR